jgi:hypothetical protein
VTTLGEQFARALAAKFWEATGPAQVPTDGRISWMRVPCSGFRPAPPG